MSEKNKNEQNFNEAGLQNVANGIVERAVEDYAIAFMGGTIGVKKPEDTMREMERWVESDYYHSLTELNGKWLLKKIKERELKRALTAYKAALSISNDVSMRMLVKTPKGTENIVYQIPPRLMCDFFDVITRQIEDLEMELAAVQSGNDKGET